MTYTMRGSTPLNGFIATMISDELGVSSTGKAF